MIEASFKKLGIAFTQRFIRESRSSSSILARAGSHPFQEQGLRLAGGQPPAQEPAEKQSEFKVRDISYFHLVEAEVEGIGKGDGLEGGEPEEGLVDDLQEGDVDEGGHGEGEEEVVEKFSGIRCRIGQ